MGTRDGQAERRAAWPSKDGEAAARAPSQDVPNEVMNDSDEDDFDLDMDDVQGDETDATVTVLPRLVSTRTRLTKQKRVLFVLFY